MFYSKWKVVYTLVCVIVYSLVVTDHGAAQPDFGGDIYLARLQQHIANTIYVFPTIRQVFHFDQMGPYLIKNTLFLV